MSIEKTLSAQVESSRSASAAESPFAAAQRWFTTIVSWLRSALVGKNSLALIDQAVVSGTRFTTTVIVGRLCGQDQLGIYSLAFAGILLAACVQESLITTPYMVFGARLRNKARALLAGSVLVYQRSLTVLAVVAMIAVALALQVGLGPLKLAPVMWLLAGVIPFTLLWEFGRRYAYAHLNVTGALAMDIGVAVIQLGGLLLLAVSGQLSALTAYAVIGLACGVVGVVWLLRNGKSFDVRLPMAGRHWRRNWSFGKWVFASQMVGVVHGFAAFWILAIALDATAAGVFAACQSIALLSNPLILAMCNLIGPLAARAHAEGGTRLVKRTVGKAVVWVGTAMILFGGVLCVAGEKIVTLIYGAEYGGQAAVVALMGISTLAWAISAAVASGLWAIQRPDLFFKTSSIGLAVTVLCAALLVTEHGVLGAAAGLMIGSFVAALLQCWVFFLSNEKTKVPLTTLR